MHSNRPLGSRFAAAFAILALISAACGSSASVSPAAPTPAAPSAPAPLPLTEHWLLTVTLSSYAEPETCKEYETAERIGQSTTLSMSVGRSGTSIHVVVFDPEEPEYHADYTGTVVDDVVTASITGSGRTTCNGQQLWFDTERRLSGRFSGDGVLTAEEVQVTRQSSGQTLTYHYDWRAVRQ